MCKDDLVEGEYYWLTVEYTGQRDIGYWNGYNFDTCTHYDQVYFEDAMDIVSVVKEGKP